MTKLTEFEISLAIQYYTAGLEAFADGEPFEKAYALSWKSGWKDGKKLTGADHGQA